MATAKPKKSPTKTQIIASISESTGVSKKEVTAVFDALKDEIEKSMKSASGVFTIPGLIKIEKKRVKARPAKKGVTNPFTGELYDQPAKPAHNKVAVRALKTLKEMV